MVIGANMPKSSQSISNKIEFFVQKKENFFSKIGIEGHFQNLITEEKNISK